MVLFKKRRHHRRHMMHNVRRRRVHRNPFSVKGITSQVFPAAIGAVGALGLDVAYGYIGGMLPATVTSNPWLTAAVKIAGAFGLGLLAGRLGDRLSLGFVVETERQVEAHLQSHLDRLPASDHASRAIVAQMKDDEAAHAAQALGAGAVELPLPAKALMRAAARVMTTTAHYV
jgi:ubiquinone biosynthesis monooxygenase Coq7